MKNIEEEYGLYEDPIEIEESIENNTKTKKVKKQKNERAKKKSGAGGKILCLFLGMIIGAGGVIGGVSGGVYWLASQPTEESLQKIDQLAGTELEKLVFGEVDEYGNVISAGLLNDKYAELTIAQLFGDVSQEVNGLINGGTTLGGISEVFPAVEGVVDSLLENTDKYAVPLDKKQLMSLPLTSENDQTLTVGKYIEESIYNIPIGDLCVKTGGTLSDVLMAISYGIEHEDYEIDANGNVIMLGGAKKTTLNDLVSKDLSPIINRLPLESIIEIDPNDSLMCSFAYGDPSHYVIENGAVKMLQVYYNVQTLDGEITFYDSTNEKVNGVAREISQNVYELILADGTQYVEVVDGVGKAYSNAILSTPISYSKIIVGDLQEDALALLDGLLLKDVLELTPDSSPILLSIAYGNDYTIENGVIKGSAHTTIGNLRKQSSALIDRVALYNVLEEDRSNGIIMHILYGKENVNYTISNGRIEMSQMFIAVDSYGIVYNEYGEALTHGYTFDKTNATFIDANGKTYYHSAVANTIKTENSTTATVYNLYDTAWNPVYFTATTIGDLNDENHRFDMLPQRLTVGEIIDKQTIESNSFLKHLQNETIVSLPDALDKLTIQQVYAKDIYKNGVSGELVPIWFYLLTVNGVEQTYKITEMDFLIENLKANVHDTSIRKLHSDGLITDLSEETMNAAVRYDITPTFQASLTENGIPYGNGVTIGDLTVTQLMLYVNLLFSALDKI